MKIWKWVLLLVLGSFIFIILYSVAQAPFFLEINPAIQIVCFLIGVTILLFCYNRWIHWFEKREAKEIALNKMLPEIGRGFGIGFLYFVFITLTMLALGNYRINEYSFDIISILQNLTMMLVVAVGEEIISRGFIFRMIAERFNIIIALVVSSLIFGFLHYPNPGATLWSSVAITLEAGVMLALAYLYHNNLWVPIGIHWAWNFSQGQIFGFAVSGMDIKNTLIQPEITGPDLITGGAFGAEASIIAIIFSVFISYYLFKKRTA